MDKIKISTKFIGEDQPCFIIAEAGVNHNGSLDLAKELVDKAKIAGADAIKFQTFKAKELVTKEASMAEYQKKNIGRTESQFDMLKKYELDYNDFIDLKDYCEKKDIIFLSTTHTQDAFDFLKDMLLAFKIGSGDLNNLPFLDHIARKGKPILLSTGMADINEVEEAVSTIKKHHDKIVLLQCTTNYPAPQYQANLKAMTTMKENFNCLVGYSDHTLGIDVSLMALSLGAVVIEKHFTLDKKMQGPDHKASLDPKELSLLTRNIRQNKSIQPTDEILGDGIKKPTKEELEIRKIVRKSIIANKDIKKGERITKDMLIIKRPGTGIPPREIVTIVGKTALSDITKDTMIRIEDIEVIK